MQGEMKAAGNDPSGDPALRLEKYNTIQTCHHSFHAHAAN